MRFPREGKLLDPAIDEVFCHEQLLVNCWRSSYANQLFAIVGIFTDLRSLLTARPVSGAHCIRTAYVVWVLLTTSLRYAEGSNDSTKQSSNNGRQHAVHDKTVTSQSGVGLNWRLIVAPPPPLVKIHASKLGNLWKRNGIAPDNTGHVENYRLKNRLLLLQFRGSAIHMSTRWYMRVRACMLDRFLRMQKWRPL